MDCLCLILIPIRDNLISMLKLNKEKVHFDISVMESDNAQNCVRMKMLSVHAYVCLCVCSESDRSCLLYHSIPLASVVCPLAPVVIISFH